MNKYLLIINDQMNAEMNWYFLENGVLITFYEDFFPELIFCETKLSLEDLLRLDYVTDVKVPISLNDRYGLNPNS